MLKTTFYFIGFFFLSISPTAVMAFSSKSATEHIINLHNRVSQELVGKMSESTRQSRFRNMMRQTFDLKKISRFVLGAHWRRANPQQRQNFSRAFESYLVRIYANAFGSYGGGHFEVKKVTLNHKKKVALVRTSVMVTKKNGGQAPANIIWRLKDYGGNYKIIDVSIEDVSMSITKRNEFSSILRRHNGQMNILIDHISKGGGKA